MFEFFGQERAARKAALAAALAAAEMYVQAHIVARQPVTAQARAKPEPPPIEPVVMLQRSKPFYEEFPAEAPLPPYLEAYFAACAGVSIQKTFYIYARFYTKDPLYIRAFSARP